MFRVNWVGRNAGLNFSDLSVGEFFKNTHGRGAVYRKVSIRQNHIDTYYMEELATAKLFEPTNSPVQLVDVSIAVSADKPNIAGY